LLRAVEGGHMEFPRSTKKLKGEGEKGNEKKKGAQYAVT